MDSRPFLRLDANGTNCNKLEAVYYPSSGRERYSLISSPRPATTGRGFLFCNLCATFAVSRPVNRGVNRGRSTVHVWAHVGTNQCPRCFCLRFGFRCSKHAARVPRWRRGDRSLRNRETSYIRLLRACLSQFLLKEPIPPKNLLYVSPFSLAPYLTKASSIVQR